MTKIDNELFKRLVLINQYTILSHVDPDQAEMWERSAEKVRDYWPIDDLPDVQCLQEAMRDPFTEENRAFVYDVFSMHAALQHAEDEGVVPTDPGKTSFAGFDGNHEIKYMSYAEALVNHDGKWKHLRFANRDFNAHHPTLDLYGRMLSEWRKHGSPFELSAAQYEAIVAARVHPANRT
ncbi:YfbU family protein [Novosphingobium rosa]|uniref:YfbU family protein n=1 Tax=Novosphingobium rosa TaxID=76978 RepID=UPI00082EF170|nr:YfbU family protein [Novosphingobium rosa]